MKESGILEIVIIILSFFVAIFWILEIQILAPTDTLLNKQGVFYSRLAAIISS
jgi:hypothetical protein